MTFGIEGDVVSKQINAKHKYLASYIAGIFGVQRPPIARFEDDEGRSQIFVLEAENSPRKGVRAFSTIGLSDVPLYLDGKEFGARVELVGACGISFNGFAEALSTAAFCVMNSRWFCAPGIIFPGVIEMHGISATMSDIYFARPFLWDGLQTVNVDGQDVAWLLAVPVSKAETEFARVHGPDKLESLFAEANVDIFDMNRDSVV